MKGSAFSTLIIFLLVSLVGIALIPKVNFSLEPSIGLPELRVSYFWHDASAEIIENQVTSQLEGLFSSIKHLKSIESSTFPGRAEIYLSFDKKTDLNLRKFEVKTLIRQSISQFSDQITYPSVEAVKFDEEAPQAILNYTLTGEATGNELQAFAEEIISPKFSHISGLKDVVVYGATPYAWELAFNPKKLEHLQFPLNKLEAQVKDAFFEGNLDRETRFSSKKEPFAYIERKNTFPSFPISVSIDSNEHKLILLEDLVRIERKVRPYKNHHRINGREAINLAFYADKKVNQFRLIDEIKDQVAKIESSLPTGGELKNTYDASLFLKSELSKILERSLMSLGILALFIWFIHRSKNYLLIILLAFAANLGTASLVYYLMDIELHIYSLAGITVSFGLVIDNSIVMIDHLYRKGNRRIFLGLLAATLTTLGALSCIFFLDEVQQVKLLDFAWVMVVNLGISLIIAWYLIPALMDYLPYQLHGQQKIGRPTKKRRTLASVNRVYRIFIKRSLQVKPILILLVVWAFGLPLFLLPEKLEPFPDNKKVKYTLLDSTSIEVQLKELYNNSIGSDTYQDHIRPQLDTWLGGSFRLFGEGSYANSTPQSPGRTVLQVTARMAYGASLEQMNQTIKRLEHYLDQFEEIDQYQTQIESSQNARLRIFFKDGYEKGSFPFNLKSSLEKKAMDLGGADWSIYGVGRGFSNAHGAGMRNSRIILYGYNYQQLRKEAEKLKEKLLLNPRIEEVFVNGRLRWDYRPNYEYILDLDMEKLKHHDITPDVLLQSLIAHGLEEKTVFFTDINKKYEEVILKPDSSTAQDRWLSFESPIQLEGGKTIKLRDLAKVRKQRTGDVIDRENQQYRLLLEYEFMGTDRLRTQLQNELVAETNKNLPLGYLAKGTLDSDWEGENKTAMYLLIFIVVAFIYIICAILLESFFQPLAVIGVIPVSFIGVFLTFSLFDFNFDQGGYAAFLLLAGISVNASLFILNDFNNLKKQHNSHKALFFYLKAFQGKIIPIGLTIISTLLGLIPFIWGAEEPFWFSLAVGVIGGLVFSIIGIIVYLPLFLLKKHDNIR